MAGARYQAKFHASCFVIVQLLCTFCTSTTKATIVLEYEYNYSSKATIVLEYEYNYSSLPASYDSTTHLIII
jgi:hypothetical protein